MSGERDQSHAETPDQERRRRKRRGENVWLPYPSPPEHAPDNPAAAKQASSLSLDSLLPHCYPVRVKFANDKASDMWRSPRFGAADRMLALDRQVNRLMRAPPSARLIAFDRSVDNLLFPVLRSTRDRMALDFRSARTYSKDGHLHVTDNIISRAQVSPYYGEEIPDSETLGLDPKKQYWLLRDPAELVRAAGTFNGKPILADHTPISADNHPHDLVVGSIGSDAHFVPPFLRATLNFWDGDAIKEINSGKRRALSCGYHYVPDMTPGVYEGKKYDGVMRQIHGQHLALVEEGRVGPMAVVADALPPGLRQRS